MVEKRVLDIDLIQTTCEARQRSTALRTAVNMAKDVTLLAGVVTLIFKWIASNPGVLP